MGETKRFRTLEEFIFDEDIPTSSEGISVKKPAVDWVEFCWKERQKEIDALKLSYKGALLEKQVEIDELREELRLYQECHHKNDRSSCVECENVGSAIDPNTITLDDCLRETSRGNFHHVNDTSTRHYMSYSYCQAITKYLQKADEHGLG